MFLNFGKHELAYEKKKWNRLNRWTNLFIYGNVQRKKIESHYCFPSLFFFFFFFVLSCLIFFPLVFCLMRLAKFITQSRDCEILSMTELHNRSALIVIPFLFFSFLFFSFKLLCSFDFPTLCIFWNQFLSFIFDPIDLWQCRWIYFIFYLFM